MTMSTKYRGLDVTTEPRLLRAEGSAGLGSGGGGGASDGAGGTSTRTDGEAPCANKRLDAHTRAPSNSGRPASRASDWVCSAKRTAAHAEAGVVQSVPGAKASAANAVAKPAARVDTLTVATAPGAADSNASAMEAAHEVGDS